MIKECIICGLVFECHSNRKTCSIECREEHKARYHRNYRSRPDVREKQFQYMQEYVARPEFEIQHLRYMRTRQSKEQYRQYHEEYRKRDYVRARMKEYNSSSKALARKQKGRLLRRGEKIKVLLCIQHGKCCYCGVDISKEPHSSIHLDHVMPVSLGGKNDPNNIILSCARCNLRKSGRHPLDFIIEEPNVIDLSVLPNGHILRQYVDSGYREAWECY